VDNSLILLPGFNNISNFGQIVQNSNVINSFKKFSGVLAAIINILKRTQNGFLSV